jgi:hypothetical protein
LIAEGGLSWDVWVINYFLGDCTHTPRSERYYMEMEKDTGYKDPDVDIPDD